MTITDTRPAPIADVARDDYDRILHIDPTGLIIGVNVRLDPRIDRGLVESVKAVGVRQAITAYYGAEGALIVEAGQRRTLAAIQAGRTTVPVQVVAAPTVDADRIVNQLAENEHRIAMRAGETALAYRQLEIGGLTAAQIARRTGQKKDTVYRQITVAASELARRAADRYDLDLLQSATVAEFDTDPETVKALIAAARTGQFDHVAQRARDARAFAERRAVLVAEFAAASIAVTDWPLSNPERTLAALGIRDEDADRHRAVCEGHAVALCERTTDDGPRWVPVPVCVDPVTNGHPAPARTAVPAEDGPAQLTEEEKAARARTAELNREWTAAVTVRREWLAALAKRRTAPAGAEAFIAAALMTWDRPLRHALDNRHALLREILGIDGDDPAVRAAVVDGASAKRATVLALVTLLAAWEGRTSRDTWRRPTDTDRAVMCALVTWGYPPSDVETLLMDDPADDAPAEVPAHGDDEQMPAEDAPAEISDEDAGAVAALDDAGE